MSSDYIKTDPSAAFDHQMDAADQLFYYLINVLAHCLFYRILVCTFLHNKYKFIPFAAALSIIYAL